MEGQNKHIKRKYKQRINEYELTYDNYTKHDIVLSNYKVSELKTAMKQMGKMRITGTKPQLIERITFRFNEINKSICIQKIFRGWFVRLIQRLRGPALKDKSICTNDSDICSLEPLDEISTSYFFSYKDKNNFIYGFDISSLVTLIATKGKFINPYTRDVVCRSVLKNVYRVYRGSYAIFADFRSVNKPLRPVRPNKPPTVSSISRLQNRFMTGQNSLYIPANVSILHGIRDKLSRIRSQETNERIRTLFLEIDQLGNYTQSSWFSELSHRDHVLFYRALYDIWYFRAGLSATIKNNICFACPSRTTPFNMSTGVLAPRDASMLDYNEIQLINLETIENLTYCGIDIEHRKIGALHALSALTLVSRDTRRALSWLYESVA